MYPLSCQTEPAPVTCARLMFLQLGVRSAIPPCSPWAAVDPPACEACNALKVAASVKDWPAWGLRPRLHVLHFICSPPAFGDDWTLGWIS